jgi:hypothetical protein
MTSNASLVPTARTVSLICACLIAGIASADNATQRVRRHERKMSFLDNGVIRLGVDLNIGGSITWLSRSGSDLNLVNSYDFGRQIQMSYYSGPVPYVVGDKQPKPEWAHIGWNPIQVGDAFGNGSNTVESSNDGKQIHVRCIPMHWPLDNVPGECFYDCWLTLEGPVVHARARLENHRPDHTQYRARLQELPAIYTNGPWYRLMTYTGDRPFTNDAPTRIIKPKGEKGPWSRWIGTESWAALIDDNDFGLGVFSPGVHEFGGGFAGKPGKGGADDNPTGYIAPDPPEIIDWNIEHEYHYDLIVGQLTDIRKYVYDHAPRPTPPIYRFESNRQNWFYANATDTGWPIRGELNVQLDQFNPQFISPVGFWNADDAGMLVIEAATNASKDRARFFWRRFGEKGFSEQAVVNFPMTTDGTFHTYRVKLSDHPAWKGLVLQIRLDPPWAQKAGEWIRIKSIGLEK